MDLKKYDLLNKLRELIHSEENEDAINLIDKYLNIKKIYIYGAGYVGGTIYNLLKQLNIDAYGFLDKRGEEDFFYYEKQVLKAENVSREDKNESLVIISLNCSNDEYNYIKKMLNKLGFDNVMYFGAVYNYAINKKFESDVMKVASLLEDEESNNIYYNYISALIKSDPNLFSPSDNQIQYILKDIPFKKGFSRFIDCGAYDGDTALDLKKINGTVEAIAFFEPDEENFSKLCEKIKNNFIADEQILFPCGVWSESKKLKFLGGSKTQSLISTQGEDFVQAVSLDDAILSFAPTFLKMDVEGAECEALLGGKKIITKYKPDLAICVYHDKEHLWNIPLIIDNFNVGYKFYLRCHGMNGLETVLYAVSDY